MSTTISRVPTSFRLPTELLEELKECAKAANRSLNNYVEGILLDVMNKTKTKKYQPRTKEELLDGFDKACKEVKLFPPVRLLEGLSQITQITQIFSNPVESNGDLFRRFRPIRSLFRRFYTQSLRLGESA